MSCAQPALCHSAARRLHREQAIADEQPVRTAIAEETANAHGLTANHTGSAPTPPITRRMGLLRADGHRERRLDRHLNVA
jgi:hypothetical protein